MKRTYYSKKPVYSYKEKYQTCCVIESYWIKNVEETGGWSGFGSSSCQVQKKKANEEDCDIDSDCCEKAQQYDSVVTLEIFIHFREDSNSHFNFSWRKQNHRKKDQICCKKNIG